MNNPASLVDTGFQAFILAHLQAFDIQNKKNTKKKRKRNVSPTGNIIPGNKVDSL